MSQYPQLLTTEAVAALSATLDDLLSLLGAIGTVLPPR